MSMFSTVLSPWGEIQFKTGNDGDFPVYAVGDRLKGTTAYAHREVSSLTDIDWGYGPKHHDGPFGSEYRVVIKNGLILHVEPAVAPTAEQLHARSDQTRELAKRFDISLEVLGLPPLWNVRLDEVVFKLKWPLRAIGKGLDYIMPSRIAKRREALVQAMSAYTRNKLQERSFARQIFPPVELPPDALK